MRKQGTRKMVLNLGNLTLMMSMTLIDFAFCCLVSCVGCSTGTSGGRQEVLILLPRWRLEWQSGWGGRRLYLAWHGGQH